jgi:hypothetical protein
MWLITRYAGASFAVPAAPIVPGIAGLEVGFPMLIPVVPVLMLMPVVDEAVAAPAPSCHPGPPRMS